MNKIINDNWSDGSENAFLEKANLSNLTFDFKPKRAQQTDGTLSWGFTKKRRWHTLSSVHKEHRNNTSSSKKIDFDPGNETPVKIGSLLGLEQVWQCIFLEYKDDIIVVDCGLEFSAVETMGADYIIPDISYLKKNQKKIRGIVLTHGHLDHIWALRDVLPQLDFQPTVYTTPLTLWLVKKLYEDPKVVSQLKYKLVNPDVDLLKLGCFDIEFVRVNHNIPETFALAINTPKWLIFNSADFKIDHTPAIDKPADLPKIARIWTEGVRLYIGDSLGSDRKGRSKSEKVIWENLDQIIKHSDGRLIIAAFASNVGRLIQIVQSAVKYNKVVFLSGRSMVNNVEICRELDYINVPREYLRKVDDSIEDLPDNRVVVLSTGAQGEEFSALARIARWEHPQIKLRKGDAVLVSATTIPGNETQMAAMLNNLVTKWITLITNNDMDVHASGHGYEEDHKLMISLVRPEYMLPFYTQPLERYAHRKIGLDMGLADDKILMPEENGAVIEMYDKGIVLAKQTMKLDTILVDGKGIWGLHGEYVMKARKIMSENGMVTFIMKIDATSKKLVWNIQIESRWFVYTTEIKKVHTDIVKYLEREYSRRMPNYDNIKQCLKDIKWDLEQNLEKSLWRTPMVIPMFVYINDGKIIWEPQPVEDLPEDPI